MKQLTSRRLDEFLFWLIVASNIPFESGPIALIIPPSARPYVLAFAAIAKFFVAELKNRQASAKPEEGK